MKYAWFLNRNSIHLELYYFSSHTPRKKGKQKTIYLHRTIMDCIPNDGKVVDHINGNTLDNRKENLRICTQADNCVNRRKNRNNTSGFKGVRWREQNNAYVAYIQVSGKNKYLGLFPTIELADNAYKKASIEFHGEFRRNS